MAVFKNASGTRPKNHDLRSAPAGILLVVPSPLSAPLVEALLTFNLDCGHHFPPPLAPCSFRAIHVIALIFLKYSCVFAAHFSLSPEM